MQRNHTHKHFTLVELLVVVAIMLIILGLTAPAFRNLAMGSAVDVASRMVSSQLMLARAEAIARRQPIAVIMPEAGFHKASNDISNYDFMAFRAAILDENAGTYTFREWVPNTSWTFLPTGSVILDVGDNIPNIITYSSENAQYEWNSSLSEDTKVEGTRNFEKVSDDSVALYHGESNSNVRCVIFNRNGKPTQRNVITIMERLPDGSRENRHNCHILEVNQYTGLTKYIYNGQN